MDCGHMNSETSTNFGQRNLDASPSALLRFTMDEWHLNSRFRFRCAENQQELADKILAESERVINETAEVCKKNKKETDHQMNLKVKDIEFVKGQIEIQKKEMDKEVEALVTYRERIIDAQKSLGLTALGICKKCITLREGRLGIDLCMDEVDNELQREIEVIEGARALLAKLLEQVNEQNRRLKTFIYVFIKDIGDKANVLLIDKHNLTLKETGMNLSVYHGSAPLDPANITQEEWLAYTEKSIDEAQKELVSGRPLRAYIDVLLKQAIEDLWKQYDIVNATFKRRIEDYKEVKVKLENQHFEIVRQANEMTMNISKLEKSLAEKEKFMGLAHTRLGNRCQRSGIELCRDEVETYLVNEVREIKENTMTIQQMIIEAQASLRYLLQIQVQLEEDINIKTNSIKIDEVDCMTLRLGINYNTY